MKTKIKFMIVFSIALSLVLFSSCKRNAIEEPSPFGPSGLSIVLHLSSSPNTLFAGTDQRESTTITATLRKYDGISLSNKTIFFEIRDSSGNKTNVGYFENNQSVVTKTTNSNGVAKVKYYGPLAHELTDNTTIYIYAYVAWEGQEEYIWKTASLYIVRDVTGIKLELTAMPNTLFASDIREVSTLTASLKTAQEIPLADQTIHFEVTDETGAKANAGYFEGNKSVISKVTDINGIATVDYYGPLAKELTENTIIYINATVAGEGSDLISTTAPIYIIRDVVDLTFELMANPNVLWCTSERPESEIKGIFRKTDGVPLVGRKVFFEILSGPGEFEDGKTKTFVLTDEDGVATITYIGPTKSEMSAAEEWVTIQGQAETYWIDADQDKYYLHKELSIRLKKGTD